MTTAATALPAAAQGREKKTAISLGVAGLEPENSGIAVNDRINEQLMEQRRIIESFSSIFFSIVLIDVKRNTFRFLTTNDKIRSVIGEEVSAQAALEKTIDYFVSPEYRSAVREYSSFSTLDSRLKGNNILTLDYIGATAGWTRAIIIPIQRSESGEVTQIIYCLRDISSQKVKEIRQQAVLEKQMAVIGGLSAEYYSVMIVDPENDAVSIFRESGDIGREIGAFFRSYGTWSAGIRAYCEKLVTEEFRAEFYRLLSVENLRTQKEDFGSNYIRANSDGETHIQLKVSYQTDKNGKRFAVVGSKNVDEEFRNRITLREAKREAARGFSIIEGLSFEYHTLWYITKGNRTLHLYRHTGAPQFDEVMSAQLKSIDYTEFVGRYILAYVAEKDRERVRTACDFETMAKSVDEKGIYTVNFLCNSENVPDSYQQMVFSKVRNEIDDVDIVLAFRDINELVHDEQEKQRALRDALAAAEYANHAKTMFLNNMSHDIRTPMNAIIGFTSLAAAHIDNTAQVQDYLRKIQTSGNHLLSLINDVLDMSRIESGKVRIEEKETHLPEVMHDLRTIVQSDIAAKHLDFYIDTVDVVNENVICDKLRINQVLMNILSNAIKFTKPGGIVSLRLKQKPCTQSGYALYEFHIKDTGIGMNREFISHVFEPFEREATSTVSGIQGTGLGMAITKNIIDMMGGTISVESEPGKGTEFTVSIKLKLCGQPANLDVLPELQGLRALVADDDAECCMSVCRMLSSIGMRSEWTTYGKEAVTRTRFAIEQGDEFNAYIIDWLMPDMNGIEVVRRIRRIIGESKPIIILTAYDWSDIEEEAKSAGVTAFCSKPIFMSELRDVLSQRAASSSEAKPQPVSAKQFSGRRVLLVEDNELNQEIAAGILEELGFAVDIANDGSVALEKMENARAGEYDLILMDIQMPIMDGYEATRRIRLLPDKHAAAVPIIAMTANAFNEDRDMAFGSGMNAFVSKPISVERLVEVMAEMLTDKA